MSPFLSLAISFMSRYHTCLFITVLSVKSSSMSENEQTFSKHLSSDELERLSRVQEWKWEIRKRLMKQSAKEAIEAKVCVQQKIK